MSLTSKSPPMAEHKLGFDNFDDTSPDAETKEKHSRSGHMNKEFKTIDT